MKKISKIYAHVQVSSNGRVIIPAELRKSASIADGDTVVMALHPGGIIQMQSIQQSIKEAKSLIKKRFGKHNLIAELKKMRKADFELDNV